MNRQSAIAALLATVLVSGLVLSPLAHYGWMALGGHYDVPTERTGDTHQSHDQGSHAAGSHADARNSGTHGAHGEARLAAFHLTCDYAGLFATTSATSPTTPSACHPLAGGQLLSVAPQLGFASDVPSEMRPRGPPQI